MFFKGGRFIPESFRQVCSIELLWSFQRLRHTGLNTIFRFHAVQRQKFFLKLSAVLSPSGTPVSFCVTFDLGSFAVHLGERWLVTGGQGKDIHNRRAELEKRVLGLGVPSL